MAREIITKIWCDVCMEDEVYAEGSETPPITLGSLKPRVLALCETHKKEVYEPLEALLRELGQILPEQNPSMARMPGTSPGSGLYPCPDPTCAKHARPYKHEQSLRNHGKDVHHTSGLKELYAKFSEAGEAALFEARAEAAAVEEKPPAITSYTCAEMLKEYTGSTKGACDRSYTWPEFKRPAQAMAVHLAKTHGVRGKKHDKKRTSRVPA